MPVNYQNGKVYKIVSNSTPKVYVGSTTQPLYKRLFKHDKDYFDWVKGNPNYLTSFELLKNRDCDIILLESCPVNTKEELHARERYWIETLDCVNRQIPLRTIFEYKADNREKIREKDRKYSLQYKADNIDKIKSVTNCLCGGSFTHAHKARHEKTKRHQNWLLSQSEGNAQT